MTGLTPPRRKRRRGSSPFILSNEDLTTQQDRFGVVPDQIRHDFVISHVLAALAPHAASFIFFGGTALSRTILNGLRLSEDIDLLTVVKSRGVDAPIAVKRLMVG